MDGLAPGSVPSPGKLEETDTGRLKLAAALRSSETRSAGVPKASNSSISVIGPGRPVLGSTSSIWRSAPTEPSPLMMFRPMMPKSADASMSGASRSTEALKTASSMKT